MPGKLVSKISERECYTLKDNDTIKIASEKLFEKHIGCMPVLNSKKNVVGIISERDLSKLIHSERFNTSLAVDQIMSKNLVTCH